VTVEQYTDFDFRFDWRISRGGNSGVKYFVLERLGAPGAVMYIGDDGRSAVGHEYQLLDDAEHPDAKNGPIRQAGALYSLVPPGPGKRLNPVGEFNESRILVQGKHVEHWLNGAKIVEYELGSPALLEAVSKSKYKDIPNFGTKFNTRLLLQDHGDEVWFRNLRIRPLAP
jgi:3-keto-disaccharide hydrolase